MTGYLHLIVAAGALPPRCKARDKITTHEIQHRHGEASFLLRSAASKSFYVPRSKPDGFSVNRALPRRGRGARDPHHAVRRASTGKRQWPSSPTRGKPDRCPLPASLEPLALSPQWRGGHAKRVSASPLARRLASQLGIDLRRLQGSGPKGRIVKRDIPLAAAEATRRPQAGRSDRSHRGDARA